MLSLKAVNLAFASPSASLEALRYGCVGIQE
jgi:hypothetical protein